MDSLVLIQLTVVVVLGNVAQWIGWRLKLPSILCLLVAGFVAGPLTGFIRPNELFGDLLLPVVSMSVALILFEGGLSLRLAELPKIGKVAWRLVSVGVVITWVISLLAARYCIGLPWNESMLLGAILVVTGPTVIGPLLRHIRPSGAVAPLLKWEGIMIDPVGASLTVLVFEVILAGKMQGASSILVFGVLRTVVAGLFLGYAGARIFTEFIRRYWIPEHLQVSLALASVVGLFAISNWFQHESGLLTVTLFGLFLGNQDKVSVKHLIDFKENLRVLIISALFIVLTARLRLEDLQGLGFGAIGFVLVLIFVARPLSVWVCTINSPLNWKERVFLGWMAPRGIVAASIASVFGLALADAGFAHARELAPITFLVIASSVLIYGLTSGPLARWLGISITDPQGTVIIGAHPLARQVAEALNAEDFDVLLIDSNWNNITLARQSGIKACYGDAISERLTSELELDNMGRLLSLTANGETNALACLHFSEIMGRAGVFQLSSQKGNDTGKHKAAERPKHLRGRTLFRDDATFEALYERMSQGAVVKTTSITEEYTYKKYTEQHGDNAIPMFVLTESHRLKVVTPEESFAPTAGQKLISLTLPAPRQEDATSSTLP